MIAPDLIFDVGSHRGEDSEFYLKKGFRVVAIEADPELAGAARERFRQSIADGQLHIVEGAIAEGCGTTAFFKSDNSVWGTVQPQWALRNSMLGAHSRSIDVPIVDIGSVFQQFGVPYYAKLDIEGNEYVILNALKSSREKPKFISIESDKRSYRKLVLELRTLRLLGYTRFKIVQQAEMEGTTATERDRTGRLFSHRFSKGASGRVGHDLPGRWLSFQETKLRYLFIFALYRLFGDYGVLRGTLVHRALCRLFHRSIPGWYDTHAALEPSERARSAASAGH
jgi:FkbM family methyltransferase